MKLPITDQFLYDLYNLIEGAGDAAHFIFRPYPTMRNALPGPKNPIFEKYRKMKNRRQFGKFIYYLKKNNLIKIRNLQGKEAILLTKKGIDKAMKASFRIENNQREKRKDGKWIMLIFDIPQRRKKERELLRSILKNLGYRLFQQSVWVSPYDISEKTEKLLQFYYLEEYVRIFLVNKI